MAVYPSSNFTFTPSDIQGHTGFFLPSLFHDLPVSYMATTTLSTEISRIIVIIIILAVFFTVLPCFIILWRKRQRRRAATYFVTQQGVKPPAVQPQPQPYPQFQQPPHHPYQQQYNAPLPHQQNPYTPNFQANTSGNSSTHGLQAPPASHWRDSVSTPPAPPPHQLARQATIPMPEPQIPTYPPSPARSPTIPQPQITINRAESVVSRTTNDASLYTPAATYQTNEAGPSSGSSSVGESQTASQSVAHMKALQSMAIRNRGPEDEEQPPPQYTPYG